MDGNGGRDVPPIIKRIDDPEQLLAQIIECLDYRDSRGLKTYVLEHKLKHESIMWELVLKIGENITAKVSEEDEEFFNVCNRCLLYLMKVGNPKEMLLAVLEQMDTFIDDIKYTCFLPLVQLTLLKIPTKLFHSLDISLETVSAHLRSLPIPENVALEGEERRLFHIDKTVVRITDILEHFLDFLEPFIKSVTLDQIDLAEGQKNEALVLKKHLIRIFDFPLLHLILTHDTSKPKSNGRSCGEKAMAMLSALETDFNRFLTNSKMKRLDKEFQTVEDDEDNKGLSEEEDEFNQEKQDNDANEKRLLEKEKHKKEKAKENDFVENWDFKLEVSEGSQSCLAYILQSEFLGLEKFPQMYSREYLLEHHLDSISFLLKNSVYPINEKGLLLCKSLVDPIPPSSLSSYCLDNPGFLTILNDLVHVMTKCPVKDHRTIALPIFTSMIRLFEDAGRYIIYESLFSSCSHSGVKGYIITLLKDDINHSIKISNAVEDCKTNCVPSKYFTGSKLNRILSLAAALPEKETSDMLENSDQIISVFNLLRFLVIADPSDKNSTGFWNYLPGLERDFLNPLRKGLDLSEAHYNLERQNVMEGKKSSFGGDGAKKVEMDVSVGGASLPVMERQEKLLLISKALNTHQLMKSLLSRLSELIDKNRSGNT